MNTSVLPKLSIGYSQVLASALDINGQITFAKLTDDLEDEWLATYFDMSSHRPNVMRFLDQGFTFMYDLASNCNEESESRLVVAYGFSRSNQQMRDSSRMRGFLGGGIEIAGKGKFDKGHALAHGMGGGMDANLFPQNPELNRGRSQAGKLFRRMERYATKYPGTFVFSRLIYNDTSWVPSSLEYGVLMQDGMLWVECFEN